jgi:hypothetical protein
MLLVQIEFEHHCARLVAEMDSGWRWSVKPTQHEPSRASSQLAARLREYLQLLHGEPPLPEHPLIGAESAARSAMRTLGMNARITFLASSHASANQPAGLTTR